MRPWSRWLVAVVLLTACSGDGSPDPDGDGGGGDGADGGGGDDGDLAVDGDGDGFFDDEDCDDADPEVHPEAVDRCGDGVDSDCDGRDTHCGPWGSATTSEAEVVLWGGETAERVGTSLAWVDDTDGDGAAELIVGDHNTQGKGGAFLLDTPLDRQATADQGPAQVLGPAAESQAGWHLATTPDSDGDGLVELAIGAHNAGIGGGVYLLSPPLSGRVDLSASEAVFWSLGLNDKAGWRLAGGDMSGDGRGDLAIGSLGWDPDHVDDVDDGAVFVLWGPSTAVRSEEDAELVLTAQAEALDLGYALDLGDLDGDGLADLAAGAPLDDTAGTNRGAVYLLAGPTSGWIHRSEVDDVVTGTEHEEECGSGVAVVEDMDGDGRGDLAVGCPRAGDQAGRVFVVPGALGEGIVDREDALGVVESDLDRALLGYEVASGDADGDGVVDLLLCAPDADSGAGAAWLFYGPLSGTLGTEEAGFVVRGEDQEALGKSCLLEDEDADGIDDIIVGARRASLEGDLMGAVLVVRGGT